MMQSNESSLRGIPIEPHKGAITFLDTLEQLISIGIYSEGDSGHRQLEWTRGPKKPDPNPRTAHRN